MFDVALYTWYVRTSFVNHTKLKTLILKLNNGVPCCELATYLHARQQQACTLLYTCVANFLFLCDWDVALYCTCVPGTWYVSLEEMKT